jgi:hypothetical protein
MPRRRSWRMKRQIHTAGKIENSTTGDQYGITISR